MSELSELLSTAGSIVAPEAKREAKQTLLHHWTKHIQNKYEQKKTDLESALTVYCQQKGWTFEQYNEEKKHCFAQLDEAQSKEQSQMEQFILEKEEQKSDTASASSSTSMSDTKTSIASTQPLRPQQTNPPNANQAETETKSENTNVLKEALSRIFAVLPEALEYGWTFQTRNNQNTIIYLVAPSSFDCERNHWATKNYPLKCRNGTWYSFPEYVLDEHVRRYGTSNVTLTLPHVIRRA